ncbi:hypothetical protein [Novosphingobium sp. CECT 9465]|uniref:hypothetical protein n=1 Tax=Novosphingobium sp. CECT 9465 TaxID=2829794 RepID=UPI001E3DB78D|nr:hypothetical protein [Novosphingobium sp. CECT 9465]CAH0498589.1 hypothetical protein NVSP9465_03680 [Novosphingobium sp. CECT 9465]
MGLRNLAVLLVLTSLPGCVAKSAFDLATLPVRAGARAVNTTADAYDRVTVSDSERDQKRGREIRKREERYGELSRDYDRALKKCDRGNDDACADAREIYGEMNAMRSSVPYERN